MPMPVRVETTEFEGLLRVYTGRARDARGFFSEVYSQRMFSEAGIPAAFVQDSMSESAKGVLRGMHYQLMPEGQGKLVRCLHGAVFDVAVDLRVGSATFGKWYGLELSAENGVALFIPVGFAHGFLVLEEASLLHYKCTAHHAPECERTLSYCCPKVGIVWPEVARMVSDRDAVAPGLEEEEYNFG